MVWICVWHIYFYMTYLYAEWYMECKCWYPMTFSLVQFSSIQSLSLRIAARQASLSTTNSWSSPKLLSIQSVMPSSNLFLCHPLLLLPPIPPSIWVFSNESTLLMRWPKYWSFSFSISPFNEHPGLISFRLDWLDLLAVQGTLKSLLQHHSSKASILRHSAFFTVQLSHPYMTTRKTIACINYDLEQRPINYNWQYTSVLIFYKFALYTVFCKYSACCCCCCSVTKSCLIPCDPMDCGTPGFLVPHHNPEFAQVHVHWISDAIQPSPSLSSSSPSVHFCYFYALFLFFLILKLLKVYKFKFINYIFIIKFNLYCSEEHVWYTLYHNLLLGILGSIIGESHPSMPKIGVCCGY